MKPRGESFPDGVLAEHGEFVRALARRLVRPDEAEEVVQETFARLLESPPEHSGNLRGWLSTVMRNLVRARGRQRARRMRREEEVARSELLPSVAEGVEEAELVKLVVTSAMELEEPYRGTILALYLRGWTHEHTAAEHGVKVVSVRSREQRALAQLRRRLDRHFDGSRAWIGLFVRTLKLEPSSVPTPAPAAPRSSRVGWSAGALTFGAVVAVVAWRGAWRETPVVTEAVALVTDTESRPPVPTGKSFDGAREVPEALPASSTARAAEVGEIRGRLSRRDGVPAAGVRLLLKGWGRNPGAVQLHGEAEWSDLETESDGEGRFLFRFAPPGAFQYALTVQDERFAALGWRLSDLHAGQRRDLEPAQLEPAGTIEGTLVDAAGEPILGQPFRLSLQPLDGFTASTLSHRAVQWLEARVGSADGRFRFTRVPPGVHRLELEHPLGRRAGPSVTLASGERGEVELRLADLDFLRELRVGALWLGYPLSGMGPPPASLRLTGPDGSVRTSDAAGVFTELEPGLHHLEFEHPWFEPVALDDLEPGRFYGLNLVGNVRAQLDLVLPEGHASAPERVSVRYAGRGWKQDTFVLHEEGALVDPLVRGLLPGDAELAVRVPGLGERRVLLSGLVAGETRTARLDFTRSTGVQGRLHHADGRPVAGVEVVLHPSATPQDGPSSVGGVGAPPEQSTDGGLASPARALSDEQGRYHFELREGGHFALEVLVPRGAPRATEVFRLETDTILKQDFVLQRTVVVTGRVLPAGEFPLERMRLWAMPSDPEAARRFDLGLKSAVGFEPDASFRLELPAGEWVLLLVLPLSQLSSDGREGGHVGGTRELTRLTLKEGQPVRLELPLGVLTPVPWEFAVHTNGTRAGKVHLWLRDEFSNDCEGQTGADGTTRLWLFPGSHRPSAGAGDWFVRFPPLEVSPGQPGRRRFDVDLVSSSLLFLDADGRPLASERVVLYAEEDGSWATIGSKRLDPSGRLTLTLNSGRYGFGRRSLDERSEIVPVDWSASGPSVSELRL